MQGEDALTLDLLLAMGPLVEAWESRRRVEALDGHLSVVSREHLLRMKSLAGRLRDLADIERLVGAGDAD